MSGGHHVQDLAGAALGVLMRDDSVADGGWRAGFTGGDGVDVRISCAGPDLPGAVPDAIVPPDRVAEALRWQGTHRLVVTAPLIVLDLAWRTGEPLRVMTYCRGDWEAELRARVATSDAARS